MSSTTTLKRPVPKPDFGVTLCWAMDYELDDMLQTVQHELALHKVYKVNMKFKQTMHLEGCKDETHLVLYNIPFRHTNALKYLENIYQSIKWLKEFPSFGPKWKGKSMHCIERVFIIVPSCSKPPRKQMPLNKQLAGQFKTHEKGVPPPPFCVFWDEEAINEMSQSDEEWYNEWLIHKDKKQNRQDFPSAETIMDKWVQFLNIDCLWLSLACEHRAAHNASHRAEYFTLTSKLFKNTLHSEKEKVTKKSIVKDFAYIVEGCLAPDMF